MTAPEVWLFFYQRDIILIACFLIPLGILAYYAAYRWTELDNFIKETPQAESMFKRWRLAPRPDECPKHRMKALSARHPCPACGWFPKR